MICLLTAGYLDLDARSGSEKGQYLSIRNYNTKEYQGRPQIWDITEDQRGILYFGNNGILVFDGHYWDRIPVNEKLVYSLEANQDGIVYAGSDNELGYLAIDERGKQVFVSLVPKILEEDRDFGAVWEVHSTASGIVFNTEQHLFRWTGDTMYTWRTGKFFNTSFHVNKEFYVREGGTGLMQLKGDSLVPVQGGERFSNTGIEGMIPFRESGILIFTENDGIFHMSPGGKDDGIQLIRHFNELDNFLFDNRITCAIRVDFNQFAIGSSGNGDHPLKSPDQATDRKHDL
jgi:hypothetical protein